MTPPAPSAFGGRASSRTTCGCASRSSAVSSMVTMRSACGIDCDSALSSVVLPALGGPRDEEVPSRARRPSAGTRAAAPSTPNSSSGTARAPKRRMVTHGPSTASGGITACRREPSARRASTIGDERSSRSPSGATTRSTRWTMRRGVEVEHDRFEPAGAFHVGAAGTVRFERARTSDGDVVRY